MRREHNGGADSYRMYLESPPGIFIPDARPLPTPFPQDYEELHREHQTQMQVAAIRNFTAPSSDEELGHYYARKITEVAIVMFNAEAYCEYLYEDGKHIYRLHAHGFTQQRFLYQQIRNAIEFQGMLRGLMQQLFNYRFNETIKLI